MDGVQRVGRHGLTLALAIIAAACSDLGGVRSRFQIERGAWEARNLRTYDYTLSRSCECLATMPVRVEVRAGTITGLSYLYNGEPVEEEYQGVFLTIDGLFAKLQEAFDYPAYSVSIEYDSTLHFPQSVWIDYDQQIADDEIGYTVSDFVDKS